ncbi:MAG TPA: chromate resistance protein ChrB domain-containing protein [Anaerolineae bacterium]|nr:chromate resistance protein ChrB domain-containing protein [Anaerolineae bacterium]
MKWVTREHVHVDRVACPWLIQRFVDQNAVFEFVPRDTDPATITDGTPFDMRGVELGHHGDKCSFEAIVAKYALTDPALLALADIVHGADVKKDMAKTPESAGLEALATGFRLLCHDDHEALQLEFPMYDALYAVLKKRLTQSNG